MVNYFRYQQTCRQLMNRFWMSLDMLDVIVALVAVHKDVRAGIMGWTAQLLMACVKAKVAQIRPRQTLALTL